jgi:beta-D-xylosidase 4
LYAGLSPSDINAEEAQRLSLQVAIEGLVMLKNDATLELRLGADSKVAMVGFWANDSSELSGIYSGRAPSLRTPVYASNKMGLSMNVATGPILQHSGANDNRTTNALEAAKKSDSIIYFGALDTSAAAEGQDRTDISRSSAQLHLIAILARLSKPSFVVVLGDMVDNIPLLTMKGVNLVLWVDWSGQDGGSAIMQIISGAFSVAGRLPVTQYPANPVSGEFYTILNAGYEPATKCKCAWSNLSVVSFTCPTVRCRAALYNFRNQICQHRPSLFNIQDILRKCNITYLDTCKLSAIEVPITNKGNRTSDIVALAFVKSDVGPKPYPLKLLAGLLFAHKELHPRKDIFRTALQIPWSVTQCRFHISLTQPFSTIPKGARALKAWPVASLSGVDQPV